ncbi:NAD(+) synthase [bacterium]|nr:NAD(+) synthase [bacterium]
MKISLAQIKYKYANFNFNYENIIKNNDESADLIIYPEIETNSAIDFDSNYQKAKASFYKKLSEYFIDKTVLVGSILIKKGKIYNLKNAYFDLNGKKIYVSDEYKDNIDCDLYILSKNRYYTINSKDFAENIEAKHDFIYMNSIMLDGENVYYGQSFAKNSKNELVANLPILEEKVETINFAKKQTPIKIKTEEEIFKITTFAMKEYCENTGFKKVILGLSGGIDSALVAVLAKEAMGAENVYTIMLPSKYSSEGSIKDSLKLVKNLGINTEEISISPMFDCFMENIAKEDKQDLAQENLQSRLRGLILMFFSNRENCLLLSTGNKSEVACGYGTLYGDMCGGLNVIADLTKTNVYKLANWINKNKEIIPQEIIEKAPSAELRPNQKDSDSLPEYDILDKIIEDYIENQLPYDELISKYEKSTVDKTIKLIYRAQFKRNQACQGIRLTENAFCSNIKLPVIQAIY